MLALPFFGDVPDEWLVLVGPDIEWVTEASEALAAIFDDSWKAKQQSSPWFKRHPFFPLKKDYFRFARMVALGACLVKLSITQREVLVVKLRDPKEFMHAEIVARIAGTLKAPGYSIDLEPFAVNFNPDLTIQFDHARIFLEAKTVTLEHEKKKSYILSRIEQHILDRLAKLPTHTFSFYTQAQKLPSDREVEVVIEEVNSQIEGKIADSAPFPWLIEKRGIIVELGGNRSYALRDKIRELVNDALKQLPRSYPAMVILRIEGEFQGYAFEKDFDRVSKSLDEVLQDENVLGVMVLVPFASFEDRWPISGFKKYFIRNRRLEKDYEALVPPIINVLNQI